MISPSNPVNSADFQGTLLVGELSSPLDDFTEFDPEDTIFQEHDPPQHLEEDPKAWKQSLPTFSKSFWECVKSVFLIQAVAGTFIAMVAVGIIFLDFSTITWCYDETPNWYKMPKSVQHLRVIAQCVRGFFLQFCVFFFNCSVFPISLLKKLNLFTIALVAAFMDVIYRLNLQMFGAYQVSWISFPVDGLFVVVTITSHLRLARHFHQRSWRNALVLCLIFSAQLIFGLSILALFDFKLFPLYIDQSNQGIKVIIAVLSPLLTVIPKVICRLGVRSLKGIIHPGSAHVLVALFYGGFAVLFRVMQAELSSIGFFIVLGIAHAIVDLLERITVTMRDRVWEYFFRRLILRQTSRQPKYRSPRSRRLIADLSIQIMMQETNALITALGFVNVYKSLYGEARPFIKGEPITDFFIRASIGLSIDLFFNTLSVLIQTRFMNIAVNRVWKKKWFHHIIVSCLVVSVTVVYFSEHFLEIVRSKYNFVKHPSLPRNNCSFPSFL